MKSLVGSLVIGLLIALSGSCFARTTIPPANVPAHLQAAISRGVSLEKCPLPNPVSLAEYRYRHGIDGSEVTVNAPCKDLVCLVHDRHLQPQLARIRTYFLMAENIIPPLPGYLFISALRAPPSLSC